MYSSIRVTTKPPCCNEKPLQGPVITMHDIFISVGGIECNYIQATLEQGNGEDSRISANVYPLYL